NARPALLASIDRVGAAVEKLVKQRAEADPWRWVPPRYNMKEIGGLSKEVGEEVAQILWRFNADPRRKVPKPSGVVLVGPSGVGKTMLAHAIAAELKLKAICVVSGPALLHAVGSFE